MSDEELPESLVQDEDEDAFVDLDLCLVRLDVRPDGSFLAQGRGRRGTQTIGFALEADAEWKTTPIDQSGSFFYWGSGSIRSVGAESDALLGSLAELYGASGSPGAMHPETRVALVALANDPGLVATNPTHMKLFFESEDPDRYAEVYVNVIASDNRLEFHEKDPDYRKPLLLVLGDGAA